ncbi:cyclic lactone autoinducer peptide [Anaerocolumna xylanovorans]|uniref:Cyclic lactone autoinducer peptide n=1 Tax=Anaerocolumna xylanovorans DSM 12503 TaxID=1121345 RepID=A0A1M7YCS3_9FIRM|nr:cyclic lactone autoinducer peptide [Anaerocolumna xylanovorans]SHO50308.1 cyclic lactone autoinducer peptide [Anaerocolumna xylanovorans DSM 12503]
MKNQLEKKVLNAVSKIAMGNAKKSANSACVFFGYQAKLPDSVKELKKF